MDAEDLKNLSEAVASLTMAVKTGKSMIDEADAGKSDPCAKGHKSKTERIRELEASQRELVAVLEHTVDLVGRMLEGMVDTDRTIEHMGRVLDSNRGEIERLSRRIAVLESRRGFMRNRAAGRFS